MDVPGCLCIYTTLNNSITDLSSNFTHRVALVLSQVNGTVVIVCWLVLARSGIRHLWYNDFHVKNDDIWDMDKWCNSTVFYRMWLFIHAIDIDFYCTQWCIQYIQMICIQLTHWGRVTHLCVGKLTIIGSDNGLSPERRQAIIWTNAGILLIGTLGTNFTEILIGIQTFSFKKMHLKMSSAKWRPFVSASMS